MKSYFVYVIASKRNGTLYVGVTNDIRRRTYEHKNGLISGFTEDHDVALLVYYESHVDVTQAIQREKRLKEWHRSWKLDLIERDNPEWRDLYNDLNM